MMSTTEILERFKIIEKSKHLTTQFKKRYGTPFTIIKTAIRGHMAKQASVIFIKKLTKDYIFKRVVFLKDDDGDVWAFFPDTFDERTGYYMSYAHIGQHSECALEYAMECEPINDKYYCYALIEELEGRDYLLEIVTKKAIEDLVV